MLKFNPVVLIMQPREIPEAISSMQKYIKFPKVWFKGFTEMGVTEEINNFVRETEYTHYIICADDVVLNEEVFVEIDKYANAFLHSKGTSRDVVTGWCNLNINHIDKSLGLESNVAEKKLTLKNGHYPTPEDYRFSSLPDIFSRKGLIQTYLASFALSCIPRETLIEHPLSTYPNGQASDHKFSYEAYANGVRIWTTPKMFIKHLREQRNAHLKRNWIVGKIEPTIIKEL